MGETMPAVFFHGTLDVCQAEAVEEGVFLGGPTVPDKGRRHGVFHQNQKHVSNPGGFQQSPGAVRLEVAYRLRWRCPGLPKSVLISKGSKK